ncbi:MAG TPA: NifU family protein [Candidatus Aminicenantes bacterium]|nr:NifU family protein [Candidatus Aminicenantes bacterium]
MTIDNQNIYRRVKDALEQLRPHLQADGGDVELVQVTPEGVVKLRFLGACLGCPMRQITLTQGITRFIKKAVPEVKGVEAI